MSSVIDHRGHRVTRRRFKNAFLHDRPPSGLARRARYQYWLCVGTWIPLLILMMLGTQWLTGWALDTLDDVIALVPVDTVIIDVVRAVEMFAFVLAGLVPVLMLWPTVVFIFMPRFADMIAAYGRCPACGYELMDLDVARDGLTVCPECGGAWRCHEKDPEPA